MVSGVWNTEATIPLGFPSTIPFPSIQTLPNLPPILRLPHSFFVRRETSRASSNPSTKVTLNFYFFIYSFTCTFCLVSGKMLNNKETVNLSPALCSSLVDPVKLVRVILTGQPSNNKCSCFFGRI